MWHNNDTGVFVSWLRIDDGFAANHKVAALTDRHLRVWLRVLCHCAKAQDPSVDSFVVSEVSGLNARTIERFSQLGLLDVSGESHEVHDWALYQPKDSTGAERQARWRSRHRPLGTGDSNNEVTAGDRYESVTSRADPHARPVPSRKDIEAVDLSVGDKEGGVVAETERPVYSEQAQVKSIVDARFGRPAA